MEGKGDMCIVVVDDEPELQDCAATLDKPCEIDDGLGCVERYIDEEP